MDQAAIMAAFFISISANYISKKPLKFLVISGFCRKFEVTTNQFTMTNLQENSIEVWKDIKGYEGYYQISNTGRVKSVYRVVNCHDGFNKTIFEKILKNKTKKRGYLFVGLSINKQVKYCHIHRLVAGAFIPNEYKKPEVNHIDGIKSNNNVSNLEWMTHAENNIHAIETGLRIADPIYYRRGATHTKSKPVYQYTLNGVLIKAYNCITDAAMNLNCCCTGISRVANNKRGGKTYYGYKWTFKPTYPLHYPVQGSLFDSRLM